MLSRKREHRALIVCLAIIFGAGALTGVGVLPAYGQWLVNVLVLGYILGRAHEVTVLSENHRRAALDAVQTFITEADEGLRNGEVPEEHVEDLETALSEAQGLLATLDEHAPWTVKIKRRRERRHA